MYLNDVACKTNSTKIQIPRVYHYNYISSQEYQFTSIQIHIIMHFLQTYWLKFKYFKLVDFD